jgi:hypothetical protein
MGKVDRLGHGPRVQ